MKHLDPRPVSFQEMPVSFWVGGAYTCSFYSCLYFPKSFCPKNEKLKASGPVTM